ncbi:MAG: hypothetical protein KJ064_27760 [Anaerolineae bacterium]|nr:hypothetical protein [Anaerolineae bacterium]
MYATEVLVFASALQVPLLYFFEDEINPDDIDHALLLEANRLLPWKPNKVPWN